MSLRPIDYIILIVLLYIITKIDKKKEHFAEKTDMEALQNLSSMYDNGTLKIKNLEVENQATFKNNVHMNKELKVLGKSHFENDFNYFGKKSGRLRVGQVWDAPGIYAEDRKDLHIGTADKNLKIRKSDIDVEKKINANGSIGTNSLRVDGAISGKTVRAIDGVYIGLPHGGVHERVISPFNKEININRGLLMNGNIWMPNNVVFADELYHRTGKKIMHSDYK